MHRCKPSHWSVCITALKSVEAKKPGHTLRDVEAKALAETLADRLEELKAGKVCQTLTDLKAASPVVTLTPTLAEMKTQTAKKTLSNIRRKALVETQAVAVAEEVTRTIKDTLTYVKPETPDEKVVDTVLDSGRVASWSQTDRSGSCDTKRYVSVLTTCLVCRHSTKE